jgi:hypothetical protein
MGVPLTVSDYTWAFTALSGTAFIAQATPTYTPVNPQDLATKQYVDDEAGDLNSNLFLLGAGAPDLTIGQYGDYYVSTPNYDFYYREKTAWVNSEDSDNQHGFQSLACFSVVLALASTTHQRKHTPRAIPNESAWNSIGTVPHELGDQFCHRP